jgi:hypothetical protein
MVGGTSHHGVHQGEHLAPRWKTTKLGGDVHQGVDQLPEVQALHQRSNNQEPGVGHKTRLVEAHPDAIDAARWGLQWRCLLVPAQNGVFVTTILAGQEALLADGRWFSARPWAVDRG